MGGIMKPFLSGLPGGFAHLLESVPAKMTEKFQDVLLGLGEFVIFGWLAFKRLSKIWRRWRLFLEQCEFIGFQSLLVVSVAATFMGGVLGYQLYLSLHLFGAEALLGGTIGVSLFRELAPVMAAIMVTGNAGAAMGAELASMRISEQIDALEVMAVDPMEYLVMPRIAAGTLMVPLLGTYFAVVASYAGALVATGIMGLDYAVYWDQYAEVTHPLDLIHCLVKGSFFGLVLTWIGCYYGFHARGGAKSVGYATRTTVVASCLTILFVDYLLTSLLPFSVKDFIAN
jgi:phospholipid/cholesterol/gamma-HCH transport system permease protein